MSSGEYHSPKYTVLWVASVCALSKKLREENEDLRADRKEDSLSLKSHPRGSKITLLRS